MQQRQPIHFRHVEIRDDQMGGLPDEEVQRRLAIVLRGVIGDPHPIQGLSYQGPAGRHIVNDGNAQHFSE